MNNDTQPSSGKKSFVWLRVIVAMVFVTAGIWYFTQPGSNTGNTNRATNLANREPVTILDFANLTLEYPEGWSTKQIAGSENCRGFSSPELTAFNQAFANQNIHETDAPIVFDVTVCNEGFLEGKVQSAAKTWIAKLGPDDVSAAQQDAPFPGAIRYTVSTIRTFDTVFVQNQDYFVRAIVERPSYRLAEVNKKKVEDILRSITVHAPSNWKKFSAWDQSGDSYNPINPQVTLYHPPEMRAYQELGGIYIDTERDLRIGPTININMTEGLIENNLKGICSAWLEKPGYTIISSTISEHTVNGRAAVTFEYRDDVFKDNNKTTCIRAYEDVFLQAVATEADSEILKKYYQKIIKTISIGDFFDIRGEKNSRGEYTYTASDYEFSVNFPNIWKVAYGDCMDIPPCTEVNFYTLTTAGRDIKVHIFAIKKNESETTSGAIARLKDTRLLFFKGTGPNQKIFSFGDNFILVSQGTASKSEYRQLVESLNDLSTGWTTYTNEEYGFKLLFPKEWANYTVTVSKNKKFTDYDFKKTVADIITFTHPKKVSANGNRGIVSFAIEVYKDPSLPLASQKLVGEFEDTRYGFTIGNGAAPDDLQALSDQIFLIRSTFERD